MTANMQTFFENDFPASLFPLKTNLLMSYPNGGAARGPKQAPIQARGLSAAPAARGPTRGAREHVLLDASLRPTDAARGRERAA